MLKRKFYSTLAKWKVAHGRGGGCAHEADLRAACIFADASTFAKATVDRAADKTADKTADKAECEAKDGGSPPLKRRPRCAH